VQEVELAAGAFTVQLQYVDVSSFKDIEPAFVAAVKKELTLSFSWCRAESSIASAKRLPSSQ